MNQEQIQSYKETVSNIKLFINIYNCEGIGYPSKIEDWKRFGKNNSKIVVNILYIKEKEICPAHISNINSSCKKQIIL